MKHNRILVFSTDDHLYPAGGAEQAFGNISERLPHITFDLVCARLRRKSKKTEVVKNVHIHRIGFGIPKFDGLLLALFGHLYALYLMRKYTYDCVWSIMASYGAFSAVRIKKRKNIPFVLTLQEGDSFEYIYNKVRHVRNSFNEIFKSADAVQAISHYLLAWGKEMGFHGQYGFVIPNGVNIDMFTQVYSEQELLNIRKSFGFAENSFILITSSRLEKKNGVKDVVSALKDLPDTVCFVVCGSGSLEQEIRAQVSEFNLEHRVAFMGFVQPNELPKYMKSADVFIRPSLTEGLGNAFLEAMAARILTVGTNAGGIPDFLTDNQTGFIVDIENPKSIASTIQKIMLIDKNAKQEILDRAESLVREKYNWDQIARDMHELFINVSKV